MASRETTCLYHLSSTVLHVPYATSRPILTKHSMSAMTAKQRAMFAHLLRMTVSMRMMSAGDGYEYLLYSFPAADADRAGSRRR